MKVETPILKRLGPVPFWRGSTRCLDGLERLYRKAMRAANAALGKSVVLLIFLGLAIDLTAAALPKVGVTIALKSGYGTEMYVSNAHFKERPITETMLKNGLDLCWCEGWKKTDPVTALKQFNAIWLIVDHETRCPHPAKETIAALKAYVEQGGGLVINHSTGRYPEAPVDAFWTEVYAAFGIDMLHELVVDPSTDRPVDKFYSVFFANTFADHPVTDGLTGLWFSYPIFCATWGPVAARYSKDWTILVSTTENGKSLPQNPITNRPFLDRTGSFSKEKIPLVACRSLGKGRIVFSTIHKDNSSWMYNIDRWPNFIEEKGFDGKRSDGLKLLENALKWASEPSLSDSSFTKNYKPVEPDKPPYYRQEAFGQRWLEKATYAKLEPKDLPVAVRGIFGVHSSYSDGSSTVAEYVAEAKKLGLSFLVFTDPLASSSAEKLEKLRADCAANSSANFYCCPGVEFVDLSGMEWIIFSEKVSWPEGKQLRDGRWYEIFDGKTMLQPTYYRGRNLYRGALLNNKRMKEIGNFDVNLVWSNHVVPMAYDVDKPLHDNFPEFLEAGPNVRRTSTISYTRVRKAADLARAAAASVTRLDTVDAVRKVCAGEGGTPNVRGIEGHEYVQLGTGVEIRDFALRRIQGTDTMQCALRVSAPAGLEEIVVADGSTRTLARFLPKGETSFATTFTFEYDAQSYPQLIVRDKKGSRAVSGAHWVYSYHAGLHRCGDNANLLACNPGITMYPSRDMELCPPAKQLRHEAGHYHLSETSFWEAFINGASAEPSLTFAAYNSLLLHGVDFPSEEKNKMPSSLTSFPLVMPNVVTIVDQRQGDWLVEPTRTEKNGTYIYCSLPPKVGENDYWRVHHRTYQLCDRVDVWWAAVYQENAPDYRGGYTILEGEIEFLKDASIYQPFTLLQIAAKNPKGPVKCFKSAGDFGPGSYYAAIPSDHDWFEVVGLKGCEAVNVSERKIKDGVEVRLKVGRQDMKVKKGEVLRYRVALGRFNEKSRGDMFVKWFAGMMDGSRFMHDAVRGKVVDVNGFLELEAEKGEAAVTVGPTWFIQRYPVRIRGLTDNGSAIFTDGGKIVKPLAFYEGLAYAEVPLEERKTWRFMNRFLADDPSLRFSYIPVLPNHPKATVQVLNPTDRPITSKVRNLMTGTSFTVTVPAGGRIEQTL